MPRWRSFCSPAGKKTGHRRCADPDWAAIHQELKRKHVTLTIVWDEYIAREPDGYRYSRFCELYRGWEARLSVTMRQSHRAGEKLFVDYAGDTVPVVVDRLTGEQTRRADFRRGARSRRASFMPRRPGRRRSGTGSRRITGLWPRSAACPRCSCRTTPKSP